VYAAQEKEAQVLRKEAGDDRDKLEALVAAYPDATTAAPTLRDLAAQYEKAGEFAAATHALRRLLRYSPDPDAAAGLKRCTRTEDKVIGPPGASLPLPFRAGWQLSLPPGEMLPVEDDRALWLHTADNGPVTAIDGTTGKERWKTSLDFCPTWAARHAD